ncbi:MAG: hypothetical protein K8S98_10965 [Planctomycetes bacterium]|nr:hypothetical protein [Planctomycetota bacterium]
MQRPFALVLFLAAGSLAALAVPRQDPATPPDEFSYVPPQLRPSYTEELFLAVLTGLYHDGVSNEVVTKLTALDPKSGWPRDFVYSCNICMPAFDAMRAYLARPGFYARKVAADTFGSGLPDEVERRLLSDDASVRRAAIRELVERWMRVHLESKRPTDAERAEWADEMAVRRKAALQLLELYKANGVSGAYETMTECAFCEAANGACKRR